MWQMLLYGELKAFPFVCSACGYGVAYLDAVHLKNIFFLQYIWYYGRFVKPAETATATVRLCK
jgi:hypothetical protein